MGCGSGLGSSWEFVGGVRGRERVDAKMLLGRASGTHLLFQRHSPGGATGIASNSNYNKLQQKQEQ